MKTETLEVYQKYRDFLFTLSDQRNELFLRSENDLDYERFFDTFNWVISYHWKIKPLYRNFKKRRSQIIKKFEYEKYEISIRPYFCTDIKNVILSFICAPVK